MMATNEEIATALKLSGWTEAEVLTPQELRGRLDPLARDQARLDPHLRYVRVMRWPAYAYIPVMESYLRDQSTAEILPFLNRQLSHIWAAYAFGETHPRNPLTLGT